MDYFHTDPTQDFVSNWESLKHTILTSLENIHKNDIQVDIHSSRDLNTAKTLQTSFQILPKDVFQKNMKA